MKTISREVVFVILRVWNLITQNDRYLKELSEGSALLLANEETLKPEEVMRKSK